MDVILLEKIGKLGSMGDTVSVRAGYARNYLLPQKKALRATDENRAYFETQRASLEKVNAEKRDDAAKDAKKLDGLTIAMIRQASEGGQLYGSVTSRDIAEAVTEAGKVKITRGMVEMNQNFKMLGLFPVKISLHAEVEAEITLNIARSADEAKIQEKTGKALIETADERDDRAEAEKAETAEAAEIVEEASEEQAA